MNVQIAHEYGHYVVYMDGEFYCTADTYAEAVREVEER